MHRLDLDDVLHELLTRACELLGAAHGYFYVRDADGQELVSRVATGIFVDEIGIADGAVARVSPGASGSPASRS